MCFLVDHSVYLIKGRSLPCPLNVFAIRQFTEEKLNVMGWLPQSQLNPIEVIWDHEGFIVCNKVAMIQTNEWLEAQIKEAKYFCLNKVRNYPRT
jgi:hypothetical protein